MNDKFLHYNDVPMNKVKLEGLIDSNGRFWGDCEDSYRYSECTHISCKRCGSVIKKGRNYCSDCVENMAIERWEKSKKMPYTQETFLVYSDALQQYFSTWQDIEDESENSELPISEMCLYHCKREESPYVDLCDVYESITPEGFDPSDMWTHEIEQACDKLNKLLEAHPVNCFTPTEIGVEL